MCINTRDTETERTSAVDRAVGHAQDMSVKEPGSLRVTGLGWALIVLFPVLVVLSFVGSHTVQVISFTACAVIGLFVAVSASGWASRLNEAREELFTRHLGPEPKPVRPPEVMDEVNDEAAWQDERHQSEADGG